MKKIGLIIVGLTTWALANLTPQSYWALEVEIRTLTIEGMQKRVECLSQEACSLDQQMELSSQYQEKINQVFKNYGTTPSKELVYENRNREAVEKYFNENEEVLEKIEELKEKFENYSNQLSALMEER